MKAYFQNLATLLDPNFYFFANHPHERIGIVEQERFWFGLLPFFILGMLLLGQKRWFVTGLVLAVLTGTILGLEVGPYLFYPFIIFAIFRGFFFVFARFASICLR